MVLQKVFLLKGVGEIGGGSWAWCWFFFSVNGNCGFNILCGNLVGCCVGCLNLGGDGTWNACEILRVCGR